MAIFIDGKQARGSLIVEGDLTMPLPTIDTASGSIATFDTDMTENLVEVKCQIVAQQSGSGTPSPSNPRPITTYTSLNLSHSGADTSNPNVTNIPFGQTVAKGVLDVTTGKLRVTHRIVEFDGSSDENWGTYATFNGFYFSHSDMKSGTNQEGLSNIFRVGVGWTSLGIRLGANNNYMYFVQIVSNISEVTDLASWKTYLSNNPVQVVYPLATPIEIQLDSITLQALLNENNIWCDTGDTSVKFLLTVGKKIA